MLQYQTTTSLLQMLFGITGLQNAGTNAFMSTLQQLSGLSAPLLPGSALNSAQWASSQSPNQTWIDTAKVAAILPMYQVFTGVKGLEISQSELIGQQNDIRASTASSTSTSSSIFPNVSVKRTRTKSPNTRRSPLFVEESSPTEALTSKDSSSHHCISTSQSIDVGVLSQPFCQVQAYDLTVRRTSTANSPCGRSSHHFNQRSPSKSSSAPMHIESQPSISQSSTHSIIEDSWTGIIDLGDLDIFTGASTKESDPEIPNVFDLGGNLLTHSAVDSPQKSISFTATSVCQAAVIHTEITSADQEFDQIFSSLESNATSSNAFSFFHGEGNNPNLSPVQFTPPDSPSSGAAEPNIIEMFTEHSTSSVHLGSSPIPLQLDAPVLGICKKRNVFSKPIAAPSPSSFKKEPLVTRPVQKCNKIPIYKQRRGDVALTYQNSVEVKRDLDDAYCFEDEEEGHSFGSIDTKEKNAVEVREKWTKVAAHHSEAAHRNVCLSGARFALLPEHQHELWEYAKKKRFSGENKAMILSSAFPPSTPTELRNSAARNKPISHLLIVAPPMGPFHCPYASSLSPYSTTPSYRMKHTEQ
ncbi:hypothetical protein V3C99_018342 [Haemonchus contortus]